MKQQTDVIRIFTGDCAIVEWIGDGRRRFPIPMLVTPWYAVARILQWWGFRQGRQHVV